MCFRRLNATHQIGCSSSRHGNTGILHYVEKREDVAWLINQSAGSAYIAILNVTMLQVDIINLLIKSPKINGLVIIADNEQERPANFSSDLKCPSDRYGLYHSSFQYSGCKKVVWNSFGNGLMFREIPFPIVTISSSADVNFILHDCYEKYNRRQDAECAMEIKDVMDAAKDTPTCMRRSKTVTNLMPHKFCVPLGNFNIFCFSRRMNKMEQLEDGAIIVIAARLDSFSLFEDRYPGYKSSVLGFVTLHAVAEALGKVKKSLEAIQSKPIMFTLFHGEAFDYIGSSRMVYDIQQRNFLPVTMESIGTFIEIGQIGLYNESEPLWIHTDPISMNSSQDVQNRVKKLVSLMIDTGKELKLHVQNVEEGSPLPPASLQQFLKSPKSSVAGVFLSNHEKEFLNRYYNSLFDTANFGPTTYDDVTKETELIQKISTTVARTVFQLLLGKSSDVKNISASSITVTNLLYCFTKDPDCELFNHTILFGQSKKSLKHIPYRYLSHYVGTRMPKPSLEIAQHQYLLAHHLGTIIVDASDSDSCCDRNKNADGYNYIYMNGPFNSKTGEREPVCVQTTASFSSAVSPAFIIKDYKWSSGLYSSWTESYVDAMSARVFLQPSQKQQIITLCVGLIVLFLSFPLVYFLNCNSAILFGSSEAV